VSLRLRCRHDLSSRLHGVRIVLQLHSGGSSQLLDSEFAGHSHLLSAIRFAALTMT
jgi:hypothetical protein